MCERERTAKEGENGDLEKRSATNLAALPMHLTPLLSRTGSVKIFFLSVNSCQRQLSGQLAVFVQQTLFITPLPGTHLHWALCVCALKLSISSSLPPYTGVGAKYSHGKTLIISDNKSDNQCLKTIPSKETFLITTCCNSQQDRKVESSHILLNIYYWETFSSTYKTREHLTEFIDSVEAP